VKKFGAKQKKNYEKSWMLILSVPCWRRTCHSARAQSNFVVYAAEYNQSTNRFGTINLLNATSPKFPPWQCVDQRHRLLPHQWTLYGISNTTAL